MPISAKQLTKEFRDISEPDAKLLSHLIQAAERESNDSERQEIIEYANRAIRGHGVEEIRGTKAPGANYRSLFGDAVAVYVNTGDTYTATVLYDTVKRKFSITSFGDFVEKHDKGYGIGRYDETRGNPSTAHDDFDPSQDNTFGRGHVPLPAKLSYLGNFCDNLRPTKLVGHKVFLDENVHMLRAKVDTRFSIMARDMETLLRLKLLRIQCNEPGTLDFYFQA